jgi:hypothetical protein
VSDNPEDAGAFFFPAYVIVKELNKSGPVNFYFDTGSSDVVMGENDIRKLGIMLSSLPHSSKPIAGWGGITGAFRLKNVCIILTDSKNEAHEFDVTEVTCGMNPRKKKTRTKGVYRIEEAQTVPIPSVLGRSFLSDHDLVAHIDVKRKEIYLETG